MITIRNKTIAHTFLPSFDNANGRLCQERLLRSRNFAAVVTLRYTPPLYLSHLWKGTEYGRLFLL